MSAHNITEGIAIGSSFGISNKLGFSILIAIMLHNIPERMIIGLIDKKERKRIKDLIFNCMLIGIFFGVGVVIGYLFGGIDERYIMICLAISAGAMLYILACELIPEMYGFQKSKKEIIYIIGFIVGMLICSR